MNALPCILALSARRHSPEARLGLGLALAFALTASSFTVGAQSPPVVSLSRLTNQPGFELRLTGQAARHHRFDATTNLFDWSPFELLLATNGTLQVWDTNVSGAMFRFYRAVEVDPVLAITRLVQGGGIEGGLLTIEGQFFTNRPGDNAVTIGGVAARVVEASPVRLVVQVPSNAPAGQVRVVTPGGAVDSQQQFNVLATNRFIVAPPPGLAATTFVVANTHGAGTRDAQPGEWLARVRRDAPVLTTAVLTNLGNRAFLYAVTVSNGPPVTIGADSTAQALVFVNPYFATRDPHVAAELLGLIRTNAQVAALAQYINANWAAQNDPTTNSAFLQAYASAVLSVGANAAGQLPSAGSRSRAAVMNRPSSAFDVDTEWLRVEGGGLAYEVKGAAFNPVDWLVLIQEVDALAAFPNGRRDFQRTYFSNLSTVNLPLAAGGFRETRGVGAELLSERLNPIKYATKLLFQAVVGPSADQAAFTLPDRDGVYLVRGIGPAVFPADERAFALANYAAEYTQVLTVNLASATFDLLGALGDFHDLEVRLRFKLAAEASKKVTSVHSADDFVQAVLELLGFALAELAGDLEKQLLEIPEDYIRNNVITSLTRNQQIMLQGLPLYKALDIASSVGSAIERASGIFGRTTPLETTLLTVGDPFQLDLISVTPPGAAPGDTINLVLRKGALDAGDGRDRVTFIGTNAAGYAEFDAEIVSAPPGTGSPIQQTLTVRLPADMATLNDGPLLLAIFAQGRRATTSFVLAATPYVTSVLPAEGFAEAEPGGPYFAVMPVIVRGYGFSAADTFIFGGATASNKFNGGGGVWVPVPRNAVTGPLTVRRQFGQVTRENSSQNFTVIGAPSFQSLVPASAPIGSYLTLTVNNLAAHLGLFNVRFSGVAGPVAAQVAGRNQVVVQVPFGALTGPVTVETPAGATQGAFTVLPGRANGGGVAAGEGSLVTLQRALDFVAGTAVPNDDADVTVNPDTQQITSLDPPFEEGDFVTDNGASSTNRFPVGALTADWVGVSGVVAANGNMTGSFDTLSASGPGVISGTLIISGNDNTVTITISNSPGHGLIIRGNNNLVNVLCISNAGDGLRIEGGRNNQVGVTAAGNGGNGVTLTGNASGNRVIVSTEYRSAFDNSLIAQGNAGHGILLLTAAAGNIVAGSFSPGVRGNALDGIRLDGAGVVGNAIGGPFLANLGNGVTITNSASSNVVSGLSADANGGSGLALGGAGAMPVGNRITVSAGGNTNYGVVVTGIADPTTTLAATTSSNRLAGTRLESGASFLQVTANAFGGDLVGVQLDGATVAGNVLAISAQSCLGDGVVINGAQRNEFDVLAQLNAGNGITVSGGARENRFTAVVAYNNTSDGVRFASGAESHVVDGLSLSLNRNGLVVDSGARNNTFRSLNARLNRQNGVLVQGAGTTGNKFLSPRIGADGFPHGGNGGDGIRIEAGATRNIVGGAGVGAHIRNNTGAAVRISGSGTSENAVLGSVLFNDVVRQLAGVIIENGASDTAVGAALNDEGNFIAENSDGIIVRNGATRVTIQNNTIQGNTNRGVLVDNATFVRIGGTAPVEPNGLNFNSIGVELRGAGCAGNQVVYNFFRGNTNGLHLVLGANNNLIGPYNSIGPGSLGVWVEGAHRNRLVNNLIYQHSTAGVLFSGGAVSNVLARHNDIIANATGVRVRDAGTIRNAIHGDGITGNTGKGIELQDGGNTGIPAPVPLGVTSQTVYGTTAASDGSLVEVFTDPDNEGQRLIGSGPVRQGRFRVAVDLQPATVGHLQQVTATVTDPQGNTSEFGRLVVTPQPASQVVFTATRDGNAELYSLQGFGQAPVRLTFNNASDTSPAISPDGRQLAFLSTRGGASQVYTMPIQGGGAVRLTTNTVAECDPAWFPGGTNIIFAAESGANWDLFIKSTGSTNLTQLTTNAAVNRQPAVSPDGTKIAFASNRGGSFDLYVMDANGANAQLLVAGLGAETRPAWSPDGQMIAFVSDRDDNPEIYTVQFDGTQLTRRTNHSASDVDPAWTAAGQLLFSSNRDEGFELYQLDTVTGATTRLTVSTGDNTQPATGVRN